MNFIKKNYKKTFLVYFWKTTLYFW